MRIVKMQADNFMRLRAVEISPDGHVVKISGRNAQGKSSVLQAIESALSGVDSKAVPRPVRDGEDSARVVLELDTLTVTRTYKGSTSSLLVEAKDGTRFPKGQTVLNSLLGQLSFDPLAFAGMDARSQVATLLDLVDLPFDPASLEADRQRVYTTRTDVNRDAKALAARLAAMPEAPDGTPDELESVTERLAEVQRAEAQYREMDASQAAVQKWADEVERLEELLATARHELEGAHHHFAAFDTNRMDDLEYLQRRLANVEQTNEAVRAKKARAAVAAEREGLVARSEKLTGELEALDQTKTDGLAAATFPVEGLSFDADGVLFNGIPFKQASSAEQLRVSLAMAMALNPELRVIRISDGSLLDSTNLKLIEEMAADKDYQVWMEMVDESGTVGVVIEDGMVAGV